MHKTIPIETIGYEPRPPAVLARSMLICQYPLLQVTYFWNMDICTTGTVTVSTSVADMYYNLWMVSIGLIETFLLCYTGWVRPIPSLGSRTCQQ